MAHYAAEGGAAKVRRTSDGGATWQESALPAQAFGPLALAVDPREADTIFLSTLVGVFRSRDGGRAWTLLDAGLAETAPANPPANSPAGFRLTTAIVAAPDASGTFWLGTGSERTGGVGIFDTHDGGASWQRSSTGLDGRLIRTLAVGVMGDTRILYAVTDDGVWSGAAP